MTKRSTPERITLRIPGDLHQKLTKAAAKRSPASSLNSEILERLYDSFRGRPEMAELKAWLNDLETRTIADLKAVQERASKVVQDAEGGKAYLEEVQRRLADIEVQLREVKR
jgi:hypothetical protein